MADNKVDQLNKLLISKFKTKVVFSYNAAKDYKSFSQRKRNNILKMIAKQAEKDANLKPKGNGNRCQSPLHHFGKIKRKDLNLRIIYRPKETENGILQMEIIAIGPRDDLKVYKIAIDRLLDFYRELGE